MSNQLQRQLCDLSDQISKITANQSRVRALTTEFSSVGGPLLEEDTTCNMGDAQRCTENGVDGVDRDIAEVEKMLQQWLVARKAPQF